MFLIFVNIYFAQLERLYGTLRGASMIERNEGVWGQFPKPYISFNHFFEGISKM